MLSLMLLRLECGLFQGQILTRVHHKNLVRLLGYCDDNDNLALVYEYMSKGSLAEHISSMSFRTLSATHPFYLLCSSLFPFISSAFSRLVSHPFIFPLSHSLILSLSSPPFSPRSLFLPHSRVITSFFASK